MTFTLGYTPEKFKLIVASGSDFFSSLRRSDDTDWPESSLVTLDFGNEMQWDATLDGPTATWDVDQAEVAAVIAAKPKKVRLWYVDGEVRLLWASGVLVAT